MLILGGKCGVFWIFFDNFRDIAKTEKIARRRGESTKMEGPGGQEWHQNQKKTHRNLLQNLKRTIILKWSQHGSKIEATWSQKNINKSMFFWFGFGMALETLMGLRGGCEGAASGPRVAHFLQRIPQGGPRARGVIKQKQAKTAGLQDNGKSACAREVV